MSISKHPIRCAGPHFQLCLFPTPLRMDVYDYFHMPFYIFPWKIIGFAKLLRSKSLDFSFPIENFFKLTTPSIGFKTCFCWGSILVLVLKVLSPEFCYCLEAKKWYRTGNVRRIIMWEGRGRNDWANLGQPYLLVTTFTSWEFCTFEQTFLHKQNEFTHLASW